MGTTIKAKVIYGLKLKRDIFKDKESTERNCNHDIDTSLNFCPVCGKPVFKVIKVNALNDFPTSKNEYKYYEGIPDFKYHIRPFFNEYGNDIMLGFEIISIDAEYGDDISNSLDLNDEVKAEINKDIVKFVEFFKIGLKTDNLKFSTHLMMYYC